MRSFSFLFVAMSMGLFSHAPTMSFWDVCCGKCVGSAYCNACKNCSRCAHCNNGGSCGVCGGGSSRNYAPSRSNQGSSGSSRSGSGFSPGRISPNTEPEVLTITLPAPATVTAAKLNVREGPGTQYGVLGRLEAGDMVTVTETAGDSWVVIEYLELIDGDFEPRQGYVFKKFLSFL